MSSASSPALALPVLGMLELSKGGYLSPEIQIPIDSDTNYYPANSGHLSFDAWQAFCTAIISRKLRQASGRGALPAAAQVSVSQPADLRAVHKHQFFFFVACAATSVSPPAPPSSCWALAHSEAEGNFLKAVAATSLGHSAGKEVKGEASKRWGTMRCWTKLCLGGVLCGVPSPPCLRQSPGFREAHLSPSCKGSFCLALSWRYNSYTVKNYALGAHNSVAVCSSHPECQPSARLSFRTFSPPGKKSSTLNLSPLCTLAKDSSFSANLSTLDISHKWEDVSGLISPRERILKVCQ